MEKKADHYAGIQNVSEREMAKIRQLSNYELAVLISEIHDHGWPAAQKMLPVLLSGLLPDEVV